MTNPTLVSSAKFTEYSVNFSFKSQAKSLFESVTFLNLCFRTIVNYGDNFMAHIPIEPSTKRYDQPKEDIVYRFITDQINYLYFGMPAFCKFIKRQESSYKDYIKTEHLTKDRNLIAKVVEIDQSILHRLYESEWSDIMNNIYLILQSVIFLWDHFDELTEADDDSVEALFRENPSYSHITVDPVGSCMDFQLLSEHMQQINNLKSSLGCLITEYTPNDQSPEKIVWRGTSAELAYLFEQLSYKGYIENPVTSNGEMNKTRLARHIWSHIVPEESKEETLIIDMRGSRLSESSSFAKAINLIPRNKKG